jgi:hypothetical protein
MSNKRILIVFLGVVLSLTLSISGNLNNYTIKVDKQKLSFSGDFYVYYSALNPQMALRPSAIKNVQYNVITWEGDFDSKQVKQVQRKTEQAGDGFDDRILEGSTQQRTADLFSLKNKIYLKPLSTRSKKGNIEFSYEKNEKFEFCASIKQTSKFGVFELTFQITPKIKGYFSVVYVGAPKVNIADATEIWQPMIWQEKRFPDMSYITAAFQCPIPTTFVQNNGITVGVVANPNEFPFNPLPMLENSRFAVALRGEKGEASPMIIAPIYGGTESLMDAGKAFKFSSLLYISKKEVSQAYEDVARNMFGFKDYRKNDICSLNKTFENIVDYSLSKYSWFIDDQKGCAYSTDVQGAVKNVSSLNPLELSIVTDRKDMFDKRAYPLIEFMLSREKFLFCLDSTQKIQSPSRKMTGPIAPVSELTSLYNIAGKNMPFLTRLANTEFSKNRVRNLEVKEKGNTWQNALWMYKATAEKQWLDKAVVGANLYLEKRTAKEAVDFNDPYSGAFFFWTGYTPNWIDLFELYEVTKNQKYLDAAHEGARHYTMFTWMSPAIPNDSVVVNKDGKAPIYWYLKSKGHHQMYSAEEKAPAWRLSEIGLTPESSGTCSGHRAIFMSNFASWMLRIAYYTKDNFLRDVAKASIIGRYRNFPGYHINTARTTIYEKEDYPLHDHKDLSVNSFHYNHIMPNATLLLDYLVTDAWYRSSQKIDFPNDFIEGYAYLQSKSSGSKAGNFYGEKAQLWMPAKLLNMSSLELNYISARSMNKLMIAFCNQSNISVTSNVELNAAKINFIKNKKYKIRIIADNQSESIGEMLNGKFNVRVSASGITAIIIDGITANVGFQNNILAQTEAWSNDYFESKDAKVRAMLLNFGNASKTAYVYLTEDDTKISSATLTVNGTKITDAIYPFEFTIPVSNEATEFNGEITVAFKNGESKTLENILLKK